MFNPLLIPLDIDIGSVADASARSVDNGGILDTFSSIFTSGFNIITGNSALLAILCVAIGLPILGGIISVFKGR